VTALRQAEQALHQAETRCQAMATGLELLAADQPVLVDGAPMAPGSSRQLSVGVELQVGSSGGVRLRIQPGGGQALAQARAQWSQGHAALAGHRRRLGVDDSDAAERIASQRQGLETELAGLRRAAAAIPWARLEEQIAALAPRQQRLDQNLNRHQPLMEQLRAQGKEPPEQPMALEGWLDQRQEALETLGAQLGRLERELTEQQRLRAEQDSGLKAHHTRLDQLSGSLSTLSERLEQLTEDHGEEATLTERLGQLETTLQARQHDLERIDAELAALPMPSSANERQLGEEKDALLTERGQHEERCQSLGATDPAAAVEQGLAEAENAAADCRAIEHQARALQLLVGLFQQARKELSERYSDPLRLAIGTYLGSPQRRRGQPRL
jgi:chromosome segregation ATPase